MDLYNTYYNNPYMDNMVVAMEQCTEYLDTIIPSSYSMSDEEYEAAIESLTGCTDDELSDEEFEYALEAIFGPDLTDGELEYYLAQEGIFRSIGNGMAKLGEKATNRFNKKQGAIAEEKRKRANFMQSFKNSVIENQRKYNAKIEERLKKDAEGKETKSFGVPEQYMTKEETDKAEKKQQALVDKAIKEADDAQKKYEKGSKLGNFLTKLSYKTKRVDKKINKLKKRITHQEEKEKKRREAEANLKKAEKEYRKAKKKEEHSRRRAIKDIAKSVYDNNDMTMNMSFGRGAHIYRPGEVSMAGKGKSGVINIGRNLPPKTMEKAKQMNIIDGGYTSPNKELVNRYTRSLVNDMEKSVKEHGDKIIGSDKTRSNSKAKEYSKYYGNGKVKLV